MSPILSDIKNKFKQGDICLQLIYINVAVFLLTSIAVIGTMLFQRDISSALLYLELPADVIRLLCQPWSLITYMFMHADVWHILFNMLWLWWFGKLFLLFYSAKHLRGLYVLGGIMGGLFYILSFNLFPYFSESINHSYLLGASASVLAIVTATAFRSPDYQVQFMFIGSIRLKYVAIFMILFDILFMLSNNAGGHLAHLGGALAGVWFAYSLNRGTDTTRWINWAIDKVEDLFRPRDKKTKMKVHYGGRQQEYHYNERKKTDTETIDRILEKLKKSGYDSLTADEKKSLFDASKK